MFAKRLCIGGRVLKAIHRCLSRSPGWCSATNFLSVLLLLTFSLMALGSFSTDSLARSKRVSSKYAAYILDVKSGRVLYSRNANALRYPASLTKMMTLYVTFQELQARRISKRTRFKVSRHAAGQAPSKLGLRAGQRIPVEKLILALVTKSANDAAVVLAEGISGSHKRFARRMTTTARAIGMKRTTFKNANGLPDRRQRTTAKDMSILALRLMKDFPRYYPYFRVRSFKFGRRTYYTHNRLLRNYRGTDGVKTGYTRASGFNLTTSVHRNGKHLIGVVLGGRTGRWRDQHMRTLLTRAFPKATRKSIRVAKRKTKRKHVRLSSRDLKRVVNKINQRQRQKLTQLIAKSTPRPVIPVVRIAKTSKAIAASRAAPSNLLVADLASLWKIQVGAFAERSMAKDRLDFILDKNFKSLEYAQSNIVHAKKNGHDLFRVRFAGLDADGAEAVCMSLQDDKVGCFALAPPHPREQASIY